MKKSLLFCTILFAAVLSSCKKENEDLYTLNVAPTVDVVSGADLAFKAVGGEGDIEVAPVEGTLEASSPQTWCHLTVDGNRIHVTVDEYAGIESRFAKVEMKAGEATGVTIVHQYGVIVRSFHPEDVTVNNKAQEIAVPYDANETLIQARSDADWLTFVPEADKLVIKVSENTSKEYREADIAWNIGQFQGKFTLVQFDIVEAGLLGSWKFVGMSGTKFNTPREMAATFSEKDGVFSLHLLYVATSTIDVTFENVVLDKSRLMLPLGGMIGKSGTNFVFPVIGPASGRLTYANCVTEGYFPMNFAKGEDGKWHASGDLSGFGEDATFRFEMWKTEEHDGQSASGLALRHITMDKLDDE